MTEPPKTPEGLDQFPDGWGVTGLTPPPEKKTAWHIWAEDYWDVPLGTQLGETFDEAVRNLHGKWNGMGGWIYGEGDATLDLDEDGTWYFRGRKLRGEKITVTWY